MKRILFIFLFLLSTVANYSQIQDADTTMERRVDQLFAQYNDINSTGAAVLVVKDGEIIYDKGFGTANLDYDIPITSSTIFHIGSVSKQFTTFAVAMLAQQGKINLDDDVRKYVPELPDYGKVITIRQLVYHTNGLRDVLSLLYMSGWQYEDVLNNEQALNIIYKQRKLAFEPGEKFSYNNSGYTLLAEIVERVTEQSIAEWMKINIFEPLGMTDSFIFDDHNIVIKNRAHSYYAEGNVFKPYNVNFTLYGPACVYSTAQDLRKWANNFYDPVVGNEQLFRLMEERGVLNNGDTTFYAFGQAVIPYKGVKRVFHSGAQAGFKSALVRFPEHKLTVIVLANSRGIDETELANKVADIYLADYIDENAGDAAPEHAPREEFEPLPLTEDQLLEYVGEYQSEEVDVKCVFVVEEGKLIARHKKHGDNVFIAKDRDIFENNGWWIDQVQFIRDNSGQIIRCLVSSGRVKNVKFNKVEDMK